MKIMLDAGHYANYNQSPHNSKYYESKQMWKLTNYQKEYLEEYQDVTVSLTRKDVDKDLALFTRGNLAKNYDLFISNHTNASSSYSTDYPVVIGAYDVSNNVLGKELVNAIKKTMGTVQEGKVWTKKNSSGGEYYGVLRGARAANVKNKKYYIVEHSFHTNKNMTLWLLNDSNLKKLAKAEVEVIAKHFNLKKKSTTQSNDYTHVVTADVLNVRSGRGTEYSIVGTLKQNDKISIWSIAKDSKGRNWGSFRYSFNPDIIGYVCMDYLK